MSNYVLCFTLSNSLNLFLSYASAASAVESAAYFNSSNQNSEKLLFCFCLPHKSSFCQHNILLFYLCSSPFSLVEIYPCVCKGLISVQGHRTLDLPSLTGSWENYIWQQDHFPWSSINASALFKLCSWLIPSLLETWKTVAD